MGRTILLLFCTLFQSTCQVLGESENADLSPRPPWTESRVIGSPEPPPPYTVEPVFAQIGWKNPIFAIREPRTDWMIVVEWPQPNTQSPQPTKSNDQQQPQSQFAPARALRVLDRAGEERTEPF